MTSLGLLVSGGVALAATPSWDFESNTVGPLSTGGDVLIYNANSPSTNAVQISSSTTPFGAANQSLNIVRASAESSSPIAQLALASTPVATGTFSFDLYIQGSGSTPAVIEINLGVLGTGNGSKRANSVAALQIWTNSTGTTPGKFLSFSDGTSGTAAPTGNLYKFNESMPISVKNTVSVSWDVVAGTYSVLLNGVLVTRGSGGSIVDSFNVTTAQAGVSDVRFTASNLVDYSFYVDNVSLSAAAIPEPGSVALLLGAAAGLMAFCARKVARS